ncbi:IS3 family transposase [Marinomonas sp. RSW2]|uniref:IS3 family transposase n=1 Tax=Marinomonas maritima TaxID=2940935 RepID=A0ABT5WHT8_9GAMM|nr:IS3 family transposase [Marinomonas maritima]MDE8604378.1 IS3 family transposase [Marinomonas maritima]
MSGKRYTDEFKIEAVKQVTERGYKIAEVAERLGVSYKSMHDWIARYSKPEANRKADDSALSEIQQLKAELKRVTEERDIPKGGRRVLCRGVKEKYTFIKSRLHDYSIVVLCRTLQVHRSGFYAWLSCPKSRREQEDDQLAIDIKTHWLESGCVYGYRNITKDLKGEGKSCGKNRVLRVMRREGLKALIGYKRRPVFYSGSERNTAPNTLNREFIVPEPDQVWVTDFTYIRTKEGWLYVTVAVDLFSRLIVGWSMRSRATAESVIDALLMAIWRRRPTKRVLVHSDQGAQYTSKDWQTFLKDNNLEASMSRRGNCHDNAVAESFFSLLKKERVRNRTYKTRSDARSEIFDYIECFYNPKRHHGSNNGLSPLQYEKRYFTELETV